jgi:5,10-methylenetetrahydromethanopterin reductase
MMAAANAPRRPIKLSAAFATSLETPDHIRLAEELGDERVWLYDMPHQAPDVWTILTLAAQVTERIGLGPGVLVPTLRHPIINATAAATLERMAPGRVAVAFGTGFIRRVMGRKPIAWSYMARYIQAFRGLLRGGIVEWDGAEIRMLHSPDSIPRFPIEIPTYVASVGPKGLAVARDLADGLFVVINVPEQAHEFLEVAYLVFGTVLDDDETESDERVRTAAGPGLMATHHAAFETYGEEVVATLPGGQRWLEVGRQEPEDEKRLAMHEGHLTFMNEADEAAWEAGAHAALRDVTLTGTADEVRGKVEAYAAQGVTELVYQPVGEVERELRVLATTLAH